MSVLNLRGLNPAPVTLFASADGEVDHAANAALARWLASVDGVTSLVILGHAGEGTFLTSEEQVALIRTYVEAVGDKLPILAGITGEGTRVAALEAKRAADAGAKGALVYPNHGWLRFGYQKGAPQDRYKAIHEASGLQCILFQYPDATKASYDLQTQLDIAAQPGVIATKNGVRNMKRWDTEIPVLRKEFPELQILTCHDEWLLPTMFDVDGLLVGFGGLTPEPLVQYLAAAKARDYNAARAFHDRLLPVTKAVYHRGSHMEGTVALKLGLKARGLIDEAYIRSPLMPLAAGAEQEIRAALQSAGLVAAEPVAKAA
jgi:4-hydroxy-tetrahydrodipicolinate synthase